MVEMLKQPQYQPMNVDRPGHEHLRRHQGLPRRRAASREVPALGDQFLTFMREQKPAVRAALEREKKLTDADRRRPEGGHRPSSRQFYRLVSRKAARGTGEVGEPEHRPRGGPDRVYER